MEGVNQLDNENLTNDEIIINPNETEPEELAESESEEAATETAEVSGETAEETAAESEAETETEETESDIEETDNDEAESTEQEDEQNDDSSEEDGEKGPAYGDVICPICGEMPVANGHEYCYKCETELSKTAIPFRAWLAGIVALLFSLVAFLMVLLISAPCLQCLKGDMYASRRIWFNAYENYSGVAEVTKEISDIMNDTVISAGYNALMTKLKSDATFDDLFSTGANFRLRIFKTVEKIYDPLKAYQYSSQVFTEPNDASFIKHNRYMKKSNEVYQIYDTTYAAMGEGIEYLYGLEQPTVEDGQKVIEMFEKARGQEGVSDVWVSYLQYNVAGYCAFDSEETFELLKKVDEDAKKDKRDYLWLYGNELISAYISRGLDDEAVPYIETLMKDDASDFNSRQAMERIYIRNGEYEKAEEMCNKYSKDNLTTQGVESDSGFNLRINLERSRGNFDSAKQLIEDANATYSLIPEFDRQLALIYLVEGDYDAAYEAAFSAEDKAYYRSYAYSDSSGYTTELTNTTYLCAYMCKKYGKCDSENAEYLDEYLQTAEYIQGGIVEKIVSGEVTIEEALTKGVCDLI